MKQDFGLQFCYGGEQNTEHLLSTVKFPSFKIHICKKEVNLLTFHQNIQIYMEQLEQWILFELHIPVIHKQSWTLIKLQFVQPIYTKQAIPLHSQKTKTTKKNEEYQT